MATKFDQPVLPTHPTLRHPRTGELLRALWVRPDGRACWPMMGGAPDPEPPTPPGPTPPTPPAPQPPPSDTGFPANTPVEQMTAPQREAYYKNQAQKWQGRAENSYGLLNDLGVKTADDAAAIKTKVTQHDALERELMTDKDKAVAEAKDEARAEVRGELIPELVRAKFEAAAAGRIEDETLTQILEPLDLSKFLTPDGKVDTAKVKTYVDGVAPAKGNPRTGPTPGGQGPRTGSDAKGTAQERAASRLERLGVKTA